MLGAPDTPAFVKNIRNGFLDCVRNMGIVEPEAGDKNTDLPTRLRREAYMPESMLHADHPNLIKQYPAHLYVDILPTYQRQGWGRKLLEKLFETLKAMQVPGIHLGVAADNDRASKFYDRVGFQGFNEMNDKGEVGRQGNTFYLVKNI